MSDIVGSTPAGPNRDQLTGFRIGVTSDRRSDELIAAFERRGAEVVHAPAIRIAPHEQDARLLLDTKRVIETRPDVVLITTSFGVRRWFDAAATASLKEDLTGVLFDSRIVVRGPKARGGIRGLGLAESAISDRETTESMVDEVIGWGVAGKSVVVQLNGAEDLVQLRRLEEAGAIVSTVAPYRWVLPDDADPVIRLIDQVIAGRIDAVTFTSAPAADAFLDAARGAGTLDALVAAFARDVVAVAVGPVTATPLDEAGIVPLMPDRYRMGALIKLLAEHLEGERTYRLPTRHGVVEIRGRIATIDGRPLVLTPVCFSIFRALVAAAGGVVSRAHLSSVQPTVRMPSLVAPGQPGVPAPGDGDHAVEVAVSRLRGLLLPHGELISTVVKRGYRIDV